MQLLLEMLNITNNYLFVIYLNAWHDNNTDIMCLMNYCIYCMHFELFYFGNLAPKIFNTCIITNFV